MMRSPRPNDKPGFLDRIYKIDRIMGKDFDRRNMNNMKAEERNERFPLHVIHVTRV